MPTYSPPIRDMQFVVHELLGAGAELRAMPPHAELDRDTIDAVLEGAGSSPPR